MPMRLAKSEVLVERVHKLYEELRHEGGST
jgi:hypothetical protein